MNTPLRIDIDRLLRRLSDLAQMGAAPDGGVRRLALTEADKLGRDVLVDWLKASGLTVSIDQVGNILGLRPGAASGRDLAPVLIGSHLDTVETGGRYDGSYGVLAALEVLQTLNDHQVQTGPPVALIAFTGEEGSRFAPDMLGSQVFCGQLSVEAAWAAQGFDGCLFGDELRRIGYAGDQPPGQVRPQAYVELHIEQGPVLDQLDLPIGAVEAVTGITWLEVTFSGQANHAGTTPMDARRDAGVAAARLITAARAVALSLGAGQRATCGRIAFSPDAINVIPSQAVLTVDLRNEDAQRLQQAEAPLVQEIKRIEAQEGVSASLRSLVRVAPARFDPALVTTIEQSAASLGYASRRMTSGAGHDAQIMARLCPAAMIFIPSRGGVSHNPAEYSTEQALEAGANVLLHTVLALCLTRGSIRAGGAARGSK